MPVRVEQDCALRGGDYFGDEHQQLPLQGLRVTSRIDDVRNLEKRGQVARHSRDP
jgi:hypothetical protein